MAEENKQNIRDRQSIGVIEPEQEAPQWNAWEEQPYTFSNSEQDREWLRKRKSEERSVANKPATSVDPREDKEELLQGYDLVINRYKDELAKTKPEETKEEREKRERREKASRIIGSVADGVRALSNLYFTTQYAPDMYNHEKESQLTHTNAWIERLRAERDANDDNRTNLILNLGNAINGRDKTIREMKAEAEARRLAREEADRKAREQKRLDELHPDKLREQQGKADRAEAEAVTAQATADKAPEMAETKLETERAKRDNYQASAESHRASATLSNAKTANERDGYPVYGMVNGKKVVVDRKKDKGQAVSWSKRNKAYDPADYYDDEVSETEKPSTDSRGKVVTDPNTKKPVIIKSTTTKRTVPKGSAKSKISIHK